MNNTQPEEPEALEEEPTITCQICFDDVPLSKWQALSCEHGFCKDCLVGHITACLDTNKFPIVCPDPSCSQRKPDGDNGTHQGSSKTPGAQGDITALIPKICSEEVFERFVDLQFKQSVATIDTLMNCLTPDCPGVYDTSDRQIRVFICQICRKQYCIPCKTPIHPGKTCEEAQKEVQATKDHKEVQEYLANKKCKQCPQCKFWVERSEGCNHMTCRCKFEFCFRCGEEYKDGGRTCECSLFDDVYGSEDEEEEVDYEEEEDVDFGLLFQSDEAMQQQQELMDEILQSQSQADGQPRHLEHSSEALSQVLLDFMEIRPEEQPAKIGQRNEESKEP